MDDLHQLEPTDRPARRRVGTPEAILQPLYDVFAGVSVRIHRDQYWVVSLTCTHDNRRNVVVIRHGAALIPTLRSAVVTSLASGLEESA